jgi:hypothetical protein
MRIFGFCTLTIYSSLCDAFSVAAREKGLRPSLLKALPPIDGDWSMGLFDDTDALSDDPTAFRVGILGDLHIGT